jgi:hypothetical protein
MQSKKSIAESSPQGRSERVGVFPLLIPIQRVNITFMQDGSVRHNGHRDEMLVIPAMVQKGIRIIPKSFYIKNEVTTMLSCICVYKMPHCRKLGETLNSAEYQNIK